MTSHSKQDLRTRILRDSGVLDINESASAEDAENVDPVVQAALEELEDENVIIFDTSQLETVENIPARLFMALSDFVRAQGMASYGIPYNADLRMAALNRLRRGTTLGSDDTPVAVGFY